MSPTAPTRHPENPASIPAVVRVFAMALGIGRPTPDQWRRLGEDLMVGDEPMDQMVEWMRSAGPTARPLFERALAEGIDSVPTAPEPLREFFTAVESTPDWVDWDLIARGRRALAVGGADSVYVARDVSLLGGYAFSGFNKTLLRTGALEKGSTKRFAETLQWALDVMADDDALRPGGPGYRSTIRVRLIHAFVRRHVAAMDDWRLEDWGLPVNQMEMSATLIGALVTPAVAGMALGIVSSPADLNAIAHVARYAGWLIGVRDDLLPVDFRDSIRVLSHALSALHHPDETTELLAIPMAADPLSWHYPNLPVLRGRIARSQHLSITTAVLGPRAMRDLGLPASTLPWYPAMRFPINLARSIIVTALPGRLDAAAAHGRREQLAFLRQLVGDDNARIGESAEHVTHAA
ncbi:oxygenase MpaB family protein [Nocardia sp. NPDC127606]|uniref:oxygenase MpaB family protein n=1 Tax=Nocardia sp. NPDC127606 TaxID=3345406 RepID=UPI003645B14D